MSKRPVDPEWFNQIYRHDLHRMDILKGFEWLKQLDTSLSKIANFGCWGSDEPFALLWTFDAAEVVVVEKDESHLSKPKDALKTFRETNPDCMDGRTIEFITADMSADIAQLPSDHFDLAYCQEVLYNLYGPDRQKLHNAINQMARIIKPGGFVVAVESKIGAQFTTIAFGELGDIPQRISEPIDISSFFEAAGLATVIIDDKPRYSYCFQKSPFRAVE